MSHKLAYFAPLPPPPPPTLLNIRYVALTYDHRLIDGREAVTFLRKVKEGIEDPTWMILG